MTVLYPNLCYKEWYYKGTAHILHTSVIFTGQYEQNLCDVRNTSCIKCPHRLPSCIGKPSGKQAFPGRLWKPDYILCYKDRTLRIEKCPVGYFHPALQKCTEAVTNGKL